MCVKIISNYIDCVVSFGIIPIQIQHAISQLLAKNGKLTSQTLDLFLDLQVTELSLSNISNLDSIALSKISNCNLLTHLTLKGCGRLTDDSLFLISQGCEKLRSITLDGCYMVTDKSLTHLIETHNDLEQIELAWIYRFTIKVIESIVNNCINLKHLSMIQCTQLNDEMLQLIGELNNLKSISIELSNFDNITDKGIENLFTKSNETIENIKLIGLNKITDQGLVTCLTGCKRINKIDISGMLNITDDAICHIAERHKTMQLIRLANCSNLTDPTVALVAKYCSTTLRDFSIDSLYNVTKKSLCEIPIYCNQLTHLNVSWVRETDDEIMEQLLKNCKQLKTITMWGCHRVTDGIYFIFIYLFN